MKRRSVVIETIEKKLSPYGFSYSGYEGLRWTFSRDMNGNIQYVVIQKSNWGDSYYLEIFTSTNQQMLRVPDITGNPRDFECLFYQNEKEQVEVLSKLANIVICYGLDKFNTIKPVKTYGITLEMKQKLFEEKQFMVEKFLEENQFTDLDDERVLQVLQEKLKKLQEKEYEEVKDNLVEIAAVYGELIVQSVGGKWEHNNGITGIAPIPVYIRVIPISDILRAWKATGSSALLQEYIAKLLEIYQYIDRCRAVYGRDLVLPKPYKESIDLEKLDRRRPWAIHIVEKYGADYEGDKTIREY